MDNKLEEKKNNTSKILIAIIIILILALGGLSYYTFFVRGKEESKPNPVVEPTRPIENGTPLDTKEKEYEVTYNNATHKIKVVEKSFLNDNSSHDIVKYKINIKIYLDNEVSYTADSYSSDSELEEPFLKTYIFDSKYLGLLIQKNSLIGKEYDLYVYNNARLIESTTIIVAGQGLAETPDSEQLNTLDKIEFDGHELLFWGMSSCIGEAEDKLNELLKEKPVLSDSEIFGKYALTVKNDKINWDVVDAIRGTGGAGVVCD